MARLIILSAYLILFNTAFGQKTRDSSNHATAGKLIKREYIKSFVDSIKFSVLKDTLKFNPEDLTNINGETKNTNPYSLVFYINSKYFYRLDIINGTMVSEFAKEILDASKIDRIIILDEKESMEIFGVTGHNGMVIISTKPKVKIKYKISGLKYNKKYKSGNNFDQRKDGEGIIRT